MANPKAKSPLAFAERALGAILRRIRMRSIFDT